MHSKSNDLVLENLPNGELAWLQPAPERVGITELGRDYLARERAFEALFGPWPTVAEAVGLKVERVA